MPANQYHGNSTPYPGRVERLLRERELRELRRSNRAEANGNHSHRGGESSELLDFRFRQNSEPQKSSYIEQYLEEAAAATRHDVRPLSAGGLVTALLGVNDFEARWIGWAGVNVPDEVGQKALTKALAEKRCIPVFLDEEIVHQYYNGYCNNILWPLFHYLGLPQEDRLATTRSFQSQFAAYKKANQMFADEYNSNMKVGWFLHTLFPSSEIHRTLPSRSELLRSVLAADLVGFHTYDYARHFVSACTRILGLEGTPEGVEDQGKLTRVAAFPIGIDSERFISALKLPKVQEHIKELTERFRGRKVMLGVDRLVMIKGIPQKILAFEKFLEENPLWRDKVVLLQIAVPTRTDVPEYQKLTSQVHEIVGRINGRFGTLTAVPIHHLVCYCQLNSSSFHMFSLYAVTDVAIVTSLRDGMNLISYEFVACQDSKRGVLILSEFAGAAQSLGAGAILVNPWNITEVADSIRQALTMSAEEREKRHHHNFDHVTTHTAQEWAEMFVSELNDTVVEAQLRTRHVPPGLPQGDAIECYLNSHNRLLILGFNATLTEQVDTPGGRGDQIKEMELKLHPDLKGPLTALCSDPKTTIVLLSGSDRRLLDENFRDYDMWLAAEHGMFLCHTKGEWMTTMPEHLNMEWVDSVKQVFEYFMERTLRSHYELRDTSLVWNYKYADVEFGRLQARDMLQHLWTGPFSNASVDVVQGSRSVEVRAVGVTKGSAIDRILGEIVHSKQMTTPIDYVLCVLGKDEDVYTFFEPELPSDGLGVMRTKQTDSTKSSAPGERRPSKQLPASKGGASKSSSHQSNKTQQQAAVLSSEKKWAASYICSSSGRSSSTTTSSSCCSSRASSSETISRNVLDLKGDNYFSCAVGRTRTNARYTLGSSDEVVSFLKKLADASS
ncbi:unnamed protein product [Linum trigynum]|uniref:Alpha,alpha-trehalose-phosphate synthase (UDP-forming) n=1 Tax=Linum trigynum TaxID=586398 RepID=A0AAV2D4T9_9ROSI